MSNEQIAQFAEAVTDRLATDDRLVQRMTDAVAAKLNGQLSGIRKDMERGFAEIGDHLDRIDADLKDVKERVDHVFTSLDDRGLI
ncbi:MAG: hypothetical protein F4X47_05550 [Gammaproteobacteria bacterium]|nr:hypothetical protein [Gammaproteobacteria bacterium]MYC51766.1 hypothetical protein [Gammaproteobacteria bacterium]